MIPNQYMIDKEGEQLMGVHPDSDLHVEEHLAFVRSLKSSTRVLESGVILEWF